MASRLNREQFFGKLQGMDQASLEKLLWTVYWRGPAPVRERIEGILDPEHAKEQERVANTPPPAATVLAEVTEFAELARAGAYLGRDRRVSPKERTRWRYTFRRLVGDAEKALRGRDVETGVAAMSQMIDLACQSRDWDYFRSEDPMEAARFVVSDAVATIWARLRDEHGAAHLAMHAPAHLVRWESRHGWTRVGWGWVSERESSLASKLAELLTIPDLWTTAATHYLVALDQVASAGSGEGGRSRATLRSENLREWNTMLVGRLVGSEQEELLEQLVAHPALRGSGLTSIKTLLAAAQQW